MNNINTEIFTEYHFRQREDRRRFLFSETWQQNLPQVFEDVPGYYKMGNIIASFGIWELWVHQFMGLIHVQPYDHVLDIAAGTNDLRLRLLRRDATLQITAIDRSKEMQERGQFQARKQNFVIESYIQDVHCLPFPDDSFDAVTIQAASRHLQLDKLFPEIRRVLKPGGWFYHCDMLRPNYQVIQAAYLEFLKLSVALTARLFGASKISRGCNVYFSDAIKEFYTPEELSHVMKICGFSNVKCNKSIWGGMVGFHSAQKSCSEQFAKPPT